MNNIVRTCLRACPIALAATLALATTLTLTACDEKKKQDGTTTTTTEPAAEAATQEAAAAVAEKPAENAGGSQISVVETECGKEGPPKTIEATFLENDDSDDEGPAYSDYRLANGDKITLNGFAPDNVKKGDKVSVTYRKTYFYDDFGDGYKCLDFETIMYVKKIPRDAITFTDTRDNQIYFAVKIGEQVWMVENLNIETGNSKCYEDYPKYCQNYGRLYDWNTAIKACPSGWHLPSREEWGKLFHHADGTSGTENHYQSETSCKNLKAKSGWENNENGTDKFGFAALPGGSGSDKGSFSSIGYNGNWWSSSEWDSNSAHYRDMGYASDADDVDYKSRFLSVRCIKN
jgi:uncharacterized protein (TIGR02145 family)